MRGVLTEPEAGSGILTVQYCKQLSRDAKPYFGELGRETWNTWWAELWRRPRPQRGVPALQATQLRDQSTEVTAGLPDYRLVCLPGWLSGWVPACPSPGFLSAWLPASLPIWLPVCLTARVASCLLAWPPDCLIACPSACLTACSYSTQISNIRNSLLDCFSINTVYYEL